MKIGILSDVHNNVVALDAVLEKLYEERCKKIVCAGDIIGIGPYPEETVQKIMAIPNLVAVRGNHEKYLLEGMPTEYPNDEGMGYEEMEHHKWEHSRLSKSSITFLHGLPYRVNFSIYNKNITVVHYCINSNNEFVNYTPNPTERNLVNMFPELEHDIVIYGHDHNRTICCSQDRWFINSGSLGCPANERNVARAAILEITENGCISIQNIEVTYDVVKVLREIERLGYPASEEIKHVFFGV